MFISPQLSYWWKLAVYKTPLLKSLGAVNGVVTHFLMKWQNTQRIHWNHYNLLSAWRSHEITTKCVGARNASKHIFSLDKRRKQRLPVNQGEYMCVLPWLTGTKWHVTALLVFHSVRMGLTTCASWRKQTAALINSLSDCGSDFIFIQQKNRKTNETKSQDKQSWCYTHPLCDGDSIQSHTHTHTH